MVNDPNYIKIDARTCRKRFHCRLETDLPKQEKVKFTCPECNALLWETNNSHPLKFLRNENLINEKNLSDHQTTSCNMYDTPIQD